MDRSFDLERYLSNGVESIVRDALRATLSNPQESVFMAKYAAASRAAAKKRRAAEDRGEHIPPYLIASITSSCNLHCAGCYSRANHACVDREPVDQLTSEEWKRIFLEARELGISFILLAGGEPLLYKSVIEEAGALPEILFPIFTNGTLIGGEYIKLFQKHRNLVPVLSIEGREQVTDERRGAGVYGILMDRMEAMRQSGVLFGASVTVTTQNMEEVMSDAFLSALEEKGCRVVFYVEFVPVTPEAAELAPTDEHRAYIAGRLSAIREEHTGMVFLSFPGDEKSSGGCLAAGRGFFHINSHGGAEPCPFSPYSDINVRDTSLKEALSCNLFVKLRENGDLLEEHAGGCTLFEKRELVESYLHEREAK